MPPSSPASPQQELKLITALAVRGKKRFAGPIAMVRVSWPLGLVTTDTSGLGFKIRGRLFRLLFNRGVETDIQQHINENGTVVYRWDELAKVMWSRNSAVLFDKQNTMICRFVMNSGEDIARLCQACQQAGLAVEEANATAQYLFRRGK